MRMASTDREGQDTRTMTLAIENTSHDRLPPLSYQVCAIGKNGWRYIGQVIEHIDAQHYMIEVWTASNKALDNFLQWHQESKR